MPLYSLKNLHLPFLGDQSAGVGVAPEHPVRAFLKGATLSSSLSYSNLLFLFLRFLNFLNFSTNIKNEFEISRFSVEFGIEHLVYIT